MDRRSISKEASFKGVGESTRGPARASEDAKMELIMGRLLQAGVLLAATVVLAGGVMFTLAHSGQRSDYRVFVSRPIQLRHPAMLLSGIAHGDSSSIIELGIVLLIATPVCRVIFAVVAFAVERDRLYTTISLIVLAVLLYGLLRAN